MPVVWGKTRAHRWKCWWGNVNLENLVIEYYFNFSVKRSGNKRFNQIPPHLAMLICRTNHVSDTHILTRKQAGSITHCKLNPTCRLEFSGLGLFGWPGDSIAIEKWTEQKNGPSDEQSGPILQPNTHWKPGLPYCILGVVQELLDSFQKGNRFKSADPYKKKYKHLFSNDVILECAPEAWWKKSGESKWWQSIFSLPGLPSIHDPVLSGSDIGSFSVSLRLLNTHSDLVL